VTLLVDTSVWSLALRRDATSSELEVAALKDALAGSDVVVTTGLVLQELLQGFVGAKARTQIVESFAALALIQPDREDHIAAAGLRNTCRRSIIDVYETLRSPLPWTSASLAASAFATYRSRGGSKQKPVPDVYIGAHAAVANLSVLTCDPAPYKSYFPRLVVVAP